MWPDLNVLGSVCTQWAQNLNAGGDLGLYVPAFLKWDIDPMAGALFGNSGKIRPFKQISRKSGTFSPPSGNFVLCEISGNREKSLAEILRELGFCHPRRLCAFFQPIGKSYRKQKIQNFSKSRFWENGTQRGAPKAALVFSKARFCKINHVFVFCWIFLHRFQPIGKSSRKRKFKILILRTILSQERRESGLFLVWATPALSVWLPALFLD